MVNIVYSTNAVIVLRVWDGPLWYIKTYANYPEIFNEQLERQHIDADLWTARVISQSYSFERVLELAAAFRSGVNSAYTKDDIEFITKSICASTIALMFRNGFSSKYARQYWIELATPKEFVSFVSKVRAEFDNMRARIGDDKMYNYLCRMLKTSVLVMPTETATFEKMIARLGRVASQPAYPNTDEIDAEVCATVLDYVETFKDVKNVDPSILKNVTTLLQGPP